MTCQKAPFDLARLRLLDGDVLDRAIARAAEVSARTIGVRRVGVWTFDVEHEALRCMHLYDDVSGHSTPDDSFTFSDFAPYATELGRARTIVADDARTHPATQCLLPAYLGPRGIGAMLDVPVVRDGQVVGVVCHEHVGGVRHWTEREIDIAGFVADMLCLVVAHAAPPGLVAASREHQALETLARVAGGVAHDFQNLLSVVLIHAARVRARPEDAAIARESSEEIRDAAEEGVRLTKQLQALIEQRTK